MRRKNHSTGHPCLSTAGVTVAALVRPAHTGQLVECGKHGLGRNQFRPDADPITRAQHLARHLAAGFALNEDAKLWAGFASLRENLIEVGFVDLAALGKDRTFLRCHVHRSASYSVSLHDATSFRYRSSA